MTAVTTGATSTGSTQATATVHQLKSGSKGTSTPTKIRGSRPQVKKKFTITTMREARNCAQAIVDDIDLEAHPRWIVTVQTAAEVRSARMNSYLWGWLYKNIVVQLEEAGYYVPLDDGREYPYSADMLHTIFKERFLCHDTLVVNGKERKECYSTSTLLMRKPKDPSDTRLTFSEYVRGIKEFVYSYWGFHIPPSFSDDYSELEKEIQRYQ